MGDREPEGIDTSSKKLRAWHPRELTQAEFFHKIRTFLRIVAGAVGICSCIRIGTSGWCRAELKGDV